MKNNKAMKAQKLRKLDQLKQEGVQVYGRRFDRTHMAASVLHQYSCLEVGEMSSDEVRVCGRIMNERFSWRFIDLEDESGSVQLVTTGGSLDSDSIRRLKLLDRGDIVGVKGKPIQTKQGPPSIQIDSWELLAKSVQPLPSDQAMFNDAEMRYRQRHLELVLDRSSRDKLRKRSVTIRAIRAFLDDDDFLEIETPILQPQAGGAEAKPFITHHNALDIDMHLRIAPELYLRRLLVGGFEKVYELGRNFRNEGLSTRHNPEFTSLELFQSFGDYFDLMNLTEKLLRHAIESVSGSAVVQYQGHELDFESPFQRITMTESIKNVCGVDVDFDAPVQRFKAIAADLGVKLTDEDSRGEIINAIFEQKVEPTLINPTFIMDYPIEVSICQQCHRSKPGYVERFELYVFGRELANGCSELNDPEEQLRRYVAHAKKRAAGHEEIPLPDLEFVAAMEYGMPPMMGLGIGIDRLVMFLVDAPSIRDVIAFPSLRPLQDSAMGCSEQIVVETHFDAAVGLG